MIPRERTRLSFVRMTWQRMHRYLADPDASRRQVTLIETLLAEAAADDGLVALARAGTKTDFAHSMRLRIVLADALSKQTAPCSEVVSAAREMDGADLAALMVECGLYERLRGARPAE